MVAPSSLVRLRAIESTTISAVVRCYAVYREHINDEDNIDLFGVVTANGDPSRLAGLAEPRRILRI